MIEMLEYGFMRQAFLAGALVALAIGLIGPLVVINRMTFIAGGISHAAYGGIGLAFFLGWHPLLGALGFAMGSAISMGSIKRRFRERADTLIGVLWAAGMALGIVFLDLTPGYKGDLMSYLFGSLLAVSDNDLMLIVALDVLIVLSVLLLYRQLVAVSFDEEFASVRGVRVNLVYLLLLVLVACAVVVLIRVVGLILVIALFTMPAAIAGRLIYNLRGIMVATSLISLFLITGGLMASYYLNLSTGATIILFSVFVYVCALVRRPLSSSRAKQNAPA
ncbi:MAG: metal ABC transporter permease [Spirochaetales bacterium]|nr:metal ABC transporter permease [Leptospiraceae bacterium]MCP5483302.1 metal ABC transporter permease [Spirochaetales bacterium]